MLTREVLHQLRRLHIRSRKAVDDPLGGAYRSIFKGAGIAFEEVREYQPGDDIRSIDWNVTARVGSPFVKRFVEERELTVMLYVDVSASLEFGASPNRLRDVLAEVGALLTLCAVSNGDKVGLMLASDVVESFLPARKGTRHALRLIRDLFVHKRQSDGTSLGPCLDRLARLLKRRSLVFVFSDFLAENFERPLQRLACRHDLVAVRLRDPRQLDLPAVGLVEFEDLETGEQTLVDTQSPSFREQYRQTALEAEQRLQTMARRSAFEILDLDTLGRHLETLVRFFLSRRGRR